MRKMKNRSNSVATGSRDLLLEFWDSLYISAIVEARNFKFDTQTDHKLYYVEKQNRVKGGREGVR